MSCLVLSSVMYFDRFREQWGTSLVNLGYVDFCSHGILSLDTHSVSQESFSF